MNENHSKTAVPFKEYPLASKDRPWTASSAADRLRRWAGGPNKEEIDFTRYRQGFAWYDSEDVENFGAYKLPHHDVIDGEIHTVFRGVVAAMGALLGARGGVDIPDSERRSVYNHLARHYREFDEEPPEFKSFTNDLAYKVAQYKAGKAEAPIVYADIKVKVTGSNIRAVLSKEIVDRDGEIVLISGLEIGDRKLGVPLLDAHNMMGSVVDNVLGRVINLKKTKVDGIPMLTGELRFARTKRAQEAKELVEDGFVDSVSIGFAVKEYDPEILTITKSALFETSLVSVPANPEALIDIGKTMDEESAKKLVNYEDIHPKIKEYRRFFMKELPGLLEVPIIGNELMDMKSVYEAIVDLKQSHKVLYKQLQSTKAENQVVLKDVKMETPKRRKKIKLVPKH